MITDLTDEANLNAIRYRGYYYDVETGLYYLQTRYYDPDTGRFVSPDTPDYLDAATAGGLNLYAYCLNDPINYFDPTGHFFEWLQNAWNDITTAVGDFFTDVAIWIDDNIGVYTATTIIEEHTDEDYFFYRERDGIRTDIISGDNTKPICLFTTVPSDWWRFWEYKVGIDFNTENTHGSFAIGLGEMSFSSGNKNQTTDIVAGINKIGYATTVHDGLLALYHEEYIRTIPTALAIGIIIENFPHFIPIAGEFIRYAI